MNVKIMKCWLWRAMNDDGIRQGMSEQDLLRFCQEGNEDFWHQACTVMMLGQGCLFPQQLQHYPLSSVPHFLSVSPPSPPFLFTSTLPTVPHHSFKSTGLSVFLWWFDIYINASEEITWNSQGFWQLLESVTMLLQIHISKASSLLLFACTFQPTYIINTDGNFVPASVFA